MSPNQRAHTALSDIRKHLSRKLTLNEFKKRLIKVTMTTNLVTLEVLEITILLVIFTSMPELAPYNSTNLISAGQSTFLCPTWLVASPVALGKSLAPCSLVRAPSSGLFNSKASGRTLIIPMFWMLGEDLFTVLCAGEG